MGRARNIRCVVIVVKNYLRPKWYFRQHGNYFNSPIQDSFTFSLYQKNERNFLKPLKFLAKSHINRKAYIAECLQPSWTESGKRRTCSGLSDDFPENPWLKGIYESADNNFARQLNISNLRHPPIRKLFNLCDEYVANWSKDDFFKKKKLRELSLNLSQSEKRGPFPFVDDSMGLLRELTQRDIFYTRARPRDWRHPKWRVYQYWRKRFFTQYLVRRRANQIDSIKSSKIPLS